MRQAGRADWTGLGERGRASEGGLGAGLTSAIDLTDAAMKVVAAAEGAGWGKTAGKWSRLDGEDRLVKLERR